ncbi:MAG: hypothetical protein AB7F75_07615 [Planctomycetota bacterium]
MITPILALILFFAPEGQTPQQPAPTPGKQITAKGLEVVRVLPDGQAAKLKFQKGDILLAYNEQPLNVFADLRALLKQGKPTDNLLAVLRAGKVYVIKVAQGALGLELAER